jgi:2-aminoethylphosphonate-pyruvate transaminase
MRYILLIPGPVSISAAVRKAAAREDLCHREPEFHNLQDRVRSGLLRVYGCDPAEWTCALLGGSGTTSIEAMLGSLLPRGARLLVIENGLYGERISQIAHIHGIESHAIKHNWTDAIDFERVEEALSGQGFTHVAAVHHETTTGRLNDITRLANLCEQRGAGLLLDAVSSFGAESIAFESPALIACAATANICLHGIPGLCFVLCRKTALEKAAEPPRSLYMHLPFWAEEQNRTGTRFTPAVNGLLALDRALQELAEQGGRVSRHAHYSNLAGRVKRELSGWGIQPLLSPGESSCVLTCYGLPPGRSYGEIHGGMKQRGFVIHAGRGSLEDGMFGIATLGDIGHYDMERLLASLSMVFSD